MNRFGRMVDSGAAPPAPSSRYNAADVVSDYWPTTGGWSTFTPPALPTQLVQDLTPDVLELADGAPTVAAALLADDVYIQLAAGDWTTVLGNVADIDGNNKIIELAAGANLGVVEPIDGMSTVWLRGENPGDGNIHCINGKTNGNAQLTDFTVDGLSIRTDVLSISTAQTQRLEGQRIAMINVDILTDGYGWYAAANDDTTNLHDLLMAHVRFKINAAAGSPATPEHPWRIMGAQRFFCVDMIADALAHGAGMRIHSNNGYGIAALDGVTSQEYYILRYICQMLGGTQNRMSPTGDIPDQAGGPDTSSNLITRVRIEDCDLFRAGGADVAGSSNWGQNDGTGADVVEFVDNRAYRDSGAFGAHLTEGTEPAAWTVSGNTIEPEIDWDFDTWYAAWDFV